MRYKKSLLVFIQAFLFFASLQVIELYLRINDYSISGPKRFIRLRELPPNSNYLTKYNHVNNDTCSINKKGKSLIRTDSDGYTLPYNSTIKTSRGQTKKILFLGGSTTLLRYIEENDRFPVLVANQLNDNQTIIEYSSLNGAVSGNNSLHSSLILIGKGLNSKPEIIVMMHAINDLSILLRYGEYWNNSSSRSLIVPTSYSQLLSKPLRKFFPYIAENIIKPLNTSLFSRKNISGEFKSITSPRVYDLEKIKSSFRSSINMFVEISLANNTLPILMTQPNRVIESYNKSFSNCLPDIRSIYPGMSASKYIQTYQSFNQIVRDIAFEKRIPLVDLDKLIPKKDSHIYDSVHLTKEGSHLVSKEIVKVIQAN